MLPHVTECHAVALRVVETNWYLNTNTKRINGSSTRAPLLLTSKLMWLTQQIARYHANRNESLRQTANVAEVSFVSVFTHT